MVVAAVILAAICYLGYKGFRRLAGRGEACGGCGQCAATTATQPATQQVVSTINLLTPITAEDRRR